MRGAPGASGVPVEEAVRRARPNRLTVCGSAYPAARNRSGVLLPRSAPNAACQCGPQISSRASRRARLVVRRLTSVWCSFVARSGPRRGRVAARPGCRGGTWDRASSLTSLVRPARDGFWRPSSCLRSVGPRRFSATGAWRWVAVGRPRVARRGPGRRVCCGSGPEAGRRRVGTGAKNVRGRRSRRSSRWL